MEDRYTDLVARAVAEALDLPLLTSPISRAVVDLNRSPWDWDPSVTPKPWPAQAFTSPRARQGLGLVPRVPLQRTVLPDEVMDWVARWHRPYHERLAQVLAQGGLLLDIHSMPPLEKPHAVDLVLGTLHGRSAAPRFASVAQKQAEKAGLVVQLNRPYAGAYIAEQHGRPLKQRHVLQIEISRARLLTPNGDYNPSAAAPIIAWLCEFCEAVMDMNWPILTQTQEAAE